MPAESAEVGEVEDQESGEGYNGFNPMNWTSSNVPGVGAIPDTSLSSSGGTTLSNNVTFGQFSTYHDMTYIIGEMLVLRNTPGTMDYIGPIENATAGEFNHYWRRQNRDVLCEAKAKFDVKLCWTTNSSLGTNIDIGDQTWPGGHHSSECDQLMKFDWKMKLFHNVSINTIYQVGAYNTAYKPIDEEVRDLMNFDKVLMQCKVWYLNIESQIEQLLAQIRLTQSMCALDPVLITDDRRCWRLVQVASAGLPAEK